MPQKSSIRFHFLSRTVIDEPRIFRVERRRPDQNVYYVKLTGPGDVDQQIRQWLEVSMEYGEQRGREPKD